MAGYADGFVMAVPKSNVDRYREIASTAGGLWMEHGALDYYECIGDDFVEHGRSFPKMCNLKPNETIIFAFIVFESRSHRDKVNAKVMKDPRMKMDGSAMPFDMKRFAMAGFKVLLKAK